MSLTSSTLSRLAAIQHLFAKHENNDSESISALFKECFSHDQRVDGTLRNKIIKGVEENAEKLNTLFQEYGKEDSSTLFKCFFNAMAFEVIWMKKEIAIIWSEYKQLAEMFFHEKETNALKAILNKLLSK